MARCLRWISHCGRTIEAKMIETLPLTSGLPRRFSDFAELQALDIHVPAFATWFAEMAALGANVQLGRRVADGGAGRQMNPGQASAAGLSRGAATSRARGRLWTLKSALPAGISILIASASAGMTLPGRGGMEFRILGPLEVLSAGQALDLGGAKQRALLAMLLLRATRSFPGSTHRGTLGGRASGDGREGAAGVHLAAWKLLGKERLKPRRPATRCMWARMSSISRASSACTRRVTARGARPSREGRHSQSSRLSGLPSARSPAWRSCASPAWRSGLSAIWTRAAMRSSSPGWKRSSPSTRSGSVFGRN